MNSRDRFNRDEISKILKRAAELEHNENLHDESEGLTLQELQQISKEVGIDPKYIQQAIVEIQEPDQSLVPNLIGGPFKYNSIKTLEGTLTDEEWEDVVSEIRRIHGGIGKTSKLDNTFEWEQRKQEVGYIQISLSPKKDATKIHINANYRYYASVIYTFTGFFGIILLGYFLDETNLSNIAQYVIGASGILGLAAGARFYLSSWMKKKRKKYNELLRHFREMLAPDNQAVESPSINIPEQESPGTDSQTDSKRKTKN